MRTRIHIRRLLWNMCVASIALATERSAYFVNILTSDGTNTKRKQDVTKLGQRAKMILVLMFGEKKPKRKQDVARRETIEYIIYNIKIYNIRDIYATKRTRIIYIYIIRDNMTTREDETKTRRIRDENETRRDDSEP